MSESSQVPQMPTLSPAESDSVSQDDVIRQYERACAEMQLAGRKLHRQMQEYQTMLDEVARLEAANTPESHEKLQRLATLIDSASFQRDEREIQRMSGALAHAVAKLKADAPRSLAARSDQPVSQPAKRVPSAPRA
ncbi:hypothetical protein PIN31009_04911 [Pandoraea iniqua]|uniref:hypothetical protein n=1 Tax=Pandoraea iniqua TaxID=2508288 RepID=UPI001240B847|nr:hypothetical protein [Pandoraea iniqua]VVE54765.1 hypothetical protein PIN31009_04911 [Pandoraea iniqua]